MSNDRGDFEEEETSIEQIEKWLAEGAIGGGLNSNAILFLLEENKRLRGVIFQALGSTWKNDLEKCRSILIDEVGDEEP